MQDRGFYTVEQEANRENRRLLAALERIPELEAPADEQPPIIAGEHRPHTPTEPAAAPQTDAQPPQRSWWRRVIGE